MRPWPEGFIKWLFESKADRMARTCLDCGKVWPSNRALGAHKKKHRVKVPVVTSGDTGIQQGSGE